MKKIISLVALIGFSTAAASTSICEGPGGTGSLLACWNFNTQNEAFIPDLSGNRYDAVVTGDIKRTEGVDGLAGLFNGDDYAVAPLSTDALDTAGFSMSFWVKTSSGSNQAVLYMEPAGQLNIGISISVEIIGGEAAFSVVGRTGSRTTIVTTASGVADGSWHHVAITRQGTNALIYIEGTLASTTMNTGIPPVTPGGSGSTTIGNGAGQGDGQGLNGSLDDIAILNRVLTAQEVQTIYQNTLNRPPVFTSSPVTSAVENQPYIYPVTTSDPDGDPMVLALIAGPQGMALSGDTLLWTPGDAQTGPNPVRLRVYDDDSAFAEQIFTIQVQNINDPPVITSSPPTVATEGLPYQYQVNVTDADPNEVLSFSLSQAPSGMSIGSTGLIGWTPTQAQAGLNPVTIIVQDLAGAADTQSYQIDVGAINDPPAITTSVIPDATEDISYGTTIQGNDPEGSALSWTLLAGPAGMTIDGETGALSFLPDNGQTGSQSVQVSVSDGVYSDTATYSLNVIAVNDPPVIDSTVPAAKVYNALTTYSTPLSATDEEGGPFTWSLAQEPAGYVINGSSMEWTPDTTQQGLDTMLIIVFDGLNYDTLQHIMLVVGPTTPVGDRPARNGFRSQVLGPGLVQFYAPGGTGQVQINLYALNGTLVSEYKLRGGGSYLLQFPGTRGLHVLRIAWGNQALTRKLLF